MAKENVPEHIYRRLAIRLLLEGNTLRDCGWSCPPSVTVNELVVGSGTSRELEELAETVPRDIIEQVAVIGGPTEVVERLAQYADLGTTHFLIRFLGKDLGKDAETLRRKVIPHFRDETTR